MLSLISTLLSPFKSTSKQTVLPTGVTLPSACQRSSFCSPPCMWTCQHFPDTLNSKSSRVCAGFQPVPATSKADIDAALQKLSANKQKWVAQPCSKRAALLRACIHEAMQVTYLISFIPTYNLASNSPKAQLSAQSAHPLPFETVTIEILSA